MHKKIRLIRKSTVNFRLIFTLSSQISSLVIEGRVFIVDRLIGITFKNIIPHYNKIKLNLFVWRVFK